jgi:hypothetical protein
MIPKKSSLSPYEILKNVQMEKLRLGLWINIVPAVFLEPGVILDSYSEL